MALDIGICGGSVGGLFSAALLARQGHRVTVMERSRQGLAGRGAGLVVQEAVLRILATLGLDEVAQRGVWAEERITLDDRGEVIERDPRRQMQMSWDLLFTAFRGCVPDRDYLGGVAVEQITLHADHVEVDTSEGRRRRFDLLLGADGQASLVRAQVDRDGHGHVGQPAYVGYAAWRGLVPEHAVPAAAAAQLFERFAFHFAPGRHALGYLVPGPAGETARGQRRYNWVWYRLLPPAALASLLDHARHPGALSLAAGEVPDIERARLLDDARRFLPPAFAAVVAAEPRPFLQPIYDYATPRMVHGRLVLLGDAAYIARPHTAMGVAKAAGDAMALAHALAPVADDRVKLEDALRDYAARREPEGRAVVDYGRLLGKSLM
ncbi:hypothetical protein ARC20_02925 [Stenotrophomonas panacihumi]|uniref:2-polyprenyl-6-methoxyphenol hydroxylase n=1 Tax=Stenotrophomonas panacihumi TaxID=676599 RepID=A0A0R0B1F4_9GAMM|nr:FAD-dependent monooxygenase [Stenotrophomonas panacihumi]KRG47886.1 hypothetical protein ARC20_02925 [Stenotrophomonas panacihumi]PTN55720.1 2-polyprenyl-6-methoxyphenol hydroxylase [Stenotrophomonas panacihumi]